MTKHGRPWAHSRSCNLAFIIVAGRGVVVLDDGEGIEGERAQVVDGTADKDRTRRRIARSIITPKNRRHSLIGAGRPAAAVPDNRRPGNDESPWDSCPRL